MNRGGGAPLRPLIAGGVLLAAAASGFLAHEALKPRPTAIALAPLPGTAAPGGPSDTGAGPFGEATRIPARAIPDRLPDITLPDRTGRPRSLASFRGHPLIVNFWASWCEPCRREIPLLQSLAHRHAAEGLELVGIAVDLRPDALEYARQAGMDYPLLIGEEGGLAAMQALGMESALPVSVFADRSGRIVAVKLGELRAREADLILDGVRDVDQGRAGLGAVRARITRGLQALAIERARSERPR